MNKPKPKLSPEERKILEDFEGGKLQSQLTPKRVKELQLAAEDDFKVLTCMFTRIVRGYTMRFDILTPKVSLCPMLQKSL